MNRRIRWKWLVTAATLAVALAFLAAACGGGGSSSTTSASGGGSTTSGSSSGKTFPDFRIAYDTGIDFLDPGLSYTVQGWEIMWNVYLPLLGYKHVNGPDGATLVPYLAQDMPTVSADGKTYMRPLDVFWPAEAYHQQYFQRNPAKAYCAAMIAPKVAKLGGRATRRDCASRSSGTRGVARDRSERRRPRPKAERTKAFEWIRAAAWAIGIWLLLSTFLVQAYFIPRPAWRRR